MTQPRAEGSSIRVVGRVAAAAVVCALVLGGSPSAFAIPTGALDPTFGDGGRVTTGFTVLGSASNANLQDLAIQADGRIVAVDRTLRFMVVARYLPDGSLDPSFGDDGRVRITFGRAGAYAFRVAIQENGDIVIGGAVSADTWSHLAVARLLPNGSLDASFGSDGKVQVGFGSRYLSGGAVALGTDGTISVGGFAEGCCPPRFAFARLLPDGSLDPSFGGTGHVTVGFHEDALMTDLALGPDGSLVGVGVASPRMGVVRLTHEGALDPSFGRGGRVTLTFGRGSEAHAVAVDDLGRVVICGGVTLESGATRIAAARLLSNGVLDPGFAGDGKLTVGMSQDSTCRDVEVNGSGVWLAGTTAHAAGGKGAFALLRLTEGGTLDPSFGGDGKVTTDFANSAGVFAMSVDAAGRPVLGGSESGPFEQFALARYAA